MKNPMTWCLLRAGGLLHRAGRWRLAGRAYAGALHRSPSDPVAAFRLGVVLHHAGDIAGARDAYSAALAAGTADRRSCLRRRARTHQLLGDRDARLADMETLLEDGVGDAEFLKGLADLYAQLDRVPEAIALLERPAAIEDPALKRRLAELKCSLGAWPEALLLYEALLEGPDVDGALLYDAALTAERIHTVPFHVDGDPEGAVFTATDPAARREAFDTGVELMRRVAEDPERVWGPYRLGRFFEAAGRGEEAAAAYQSACDRAEAADRSWSEHRMALWGFRRDYVSRTGEEADDRLALTVRPGPGRVALADIAGHCTVGVSNFGLAVAGFTFHGRERTVTLHVDGEPIVSAAVKSSGWRPEFQIAFKHPVVQTLGPTTVLTVTCGGVPLAMGDMADSVLLDNPRGTGEFARLRAEGQTVNKKGHWSPPAHATTDYEAGVVKAYGRFRDFLESEFGREAFLIYGTLLGCHRNGALIPGDDDFDIALVSRGDGPEEAKADSIAIMKSCLAHGFDVGVGFEGRPFNLRIDGYVIDVNPVWFHRGRAWAFNTHDLRPEHFAPARRAVLAGSEVYVPADPDAFLAENYGPDWRRPRSDFKYYRSKETLHTVRRTQLVLSEVRAIRAYAEALRRESPSAGTFYGWVERPGRAV
ncbi:M48 family metallopeptidase [Glycomyces sp. NRRL B-16210]|uniref:tetratricopeptide repeat protein n=1 Tax=Glycomyces sp. NRRL B-16210 TaxID=1463821 RepID=UPI00042F182F|nr:tetratricopeptide repeat protein [Glycomyces sp. NRRL B-16210]AHL24482.1 LicD family protein [Glycomyces sp. NRRL B-16210]